MSVWREVQEALYQRFADEWGPTSPYVFGNEKIDPPNGLWVRFEVIRLPGGPGTLGPIGSKKMDRVGAVVITLREPPGDGVGKTSDRAEQAASIFENRRLTPHDIRFAEVEPGEAGDIDKGRWWGLSVDGRFDYEETK